MGKRIAALLIALALATPVAAQDQSSGWSKDRQTGCQIWNPQPQADESVEWSGLCRDGLAEAPGTLRWLVKGALHSTEEVSFRAGRQTGAVRSVSRYGDVTIGTYDNGKPVGSWIFQHDASRVELEYRDGVVQPNAKWFGYGGTSYVGGWQGGRPHGIGTLTTITGAVYSGRWTHGCFSEGDRRTRFGATPQECGFD